MSNGLGGYQENTLFDLDLKVTQDVAKYPLHHVTYTPAKFEVATQMAQREIQLQETAHTRTDRRTTD